jgi:hypothetical protein
MASGAAFAGKNMSGASQMLLGDIVDAPPDMRTFVMHVDSGLYKKIVQIATSLTAFVTDVLQGYFHPISVDGGAIRTLVLQGHAPSVDHTIADIDVKIKTMLPFPHRELLIATLGPIFRCGGKMIKSKGMTFTILDCATLEAVGGITLVKLRATFPDGEEMDVDLSDTSEEALVDFDINTMSLDFTPEHPKGKLKLTVAAVAAMKATVMEKPQECHIIRTVLDSPGLTVERLHLAFSRVIKMILKGYRVHGISAFSDVAGDCCPICLTDASEGKDPEREVDPAAKIYAQLQRHAIHLHCDHKICIWCFMKDAAKRLSGEAHLESCPTCRASAPGGGMSIYSPLVTPSVKETLTPDIEGMLGIHLLYADFPSPQMDPEPDVPTVTPSICTLIQQALVMHDAPSPAPAPAPPATRGESKSDEASDRRPRSTSRPLTSPYRPPHHPSRSGSGGRGGDSSSVSRSTFGTPVGRRTGRGGGSSTSTVRRSHWFRSRRGPVSS